jgi:hypothetical protein
MAFNWALLRAVNVTVMDRYLFPLLGRLDEVYSLGFRWRLKISSTADEKAFVLCPMTLMGNVQGNIRQPGRSFVGFMRLSSVNKPDKSI